MMGMKRLVAVNFAFVVLYSIKVGPGICKAPFNIHGDGRWIDTPFRQTRVPRLHTVRFSLALGSGQWGDRPEHTLAL